MWRLVAYDGGGVGTWYKAEAIGGSAPSVAGIGADTAAKKKKKKLLKFQR